MKDVVMHGAGNRFLLHFGSEDPMMLMEQHEHLDGVLSLTPDEETDFYMSICNADGSIAEQCGNGLRCVALHAVRSNAVKDKHVSINTIAGICHCTVELDRNEVEVQLSVPEIGPDSCHVKDPIDGLPELQYVSMGNPNAVLWTKDDPVEVRDALAPDIVSNQAFKTGINLHVARRDDTNHATCASWERGVGPTLASGTGGASVFVAADVEGPFYVSSIGGVLTYRVVDGGVMMTGPAGYV